MVAACLPPWVVAVDGRSPCKTTHLSCGRWRVPLLAVVSTLFFACEPWWISLLTRFSLELYKPGRESRAKRAAMWFRLGRAVRKFGGIHPRNTCDASGNAPAKKIKKAGSNRQLISGPRGLESVVVHLESVFSHIPPP